MPLSFSNSTQTPLNSGSTFNGTSEDLIDVKKLTINFVSDTSSTLTVKFSVDNSNFDFVHNYEIPANTQRSVDLKPEGRFFKLSITNTNPNTNQTFLRCEVSFLQSYSFGVGLNSNSRTPIEKFGESQAVDDTESTVWNTGGNYTGWVSAAGTTSIENISENAVDVVLRLEGLDTNFDLVSEDVTVTEDPYDTGITVNATTQFRRVFRAYIKEETTALDGALRVKIGSSVVAVVQSPDNQTLLALYSVPRNYEIKIHDLLITSTNNNNNDMRYIMRIKPADASGPWRTIFKHATSKDIQAAFNTPIVIGEKTDIEWRAARVSGTGNQSVTVNFHFCLDKISL